MAWESGPAIKLVGYTAGADLSNSQYHFVEIGAGKTVTVCNAATDIPIGVLQNKPASGQTAEVLMCGVSKVVADADLAIGDLIGTSGDGQADAKVPGTDTTNYIVGRVLEENTTAGGIVTAAINCLAPSRAA